MSSSKFSINKSKDLSFDLRQHRLKMRKLKFKRIYLRFRIFLDFFQFLPCHIACHWIAFRYWFLTGEIMQEYLELLEDQRDESGSSGSE